MEGLTLSIVFVPFLCKDSVKKWKDLPSGSHEDPSFFFSETAVDNFLLECILALELNLFLTKRKDAKDVVFSCKRILPIFIDDNLKVSEFSEMFASATVNKAEEILRSLGVLAQSENIKRSCNCNAAYMHRLRTFVMQLSAGTLR